MSDRVQIKRQLFQWAQERSRISEEELCAKFPKYPQWLTGGSGPTMKQLEKFAAQTYTPLGYFFSRSRRRSGCRSPISGP